MRHGWILLALTFLVACQPVATVPTSTGIVPVATNTAVPEGTTVNYKLRQPQSADLLELIDSVLRMEEQFKYSEDISSLVREREPESLHYLIGQDFERYYAEGFTDAKNMVTLAKLPWDLKSYADLSSLSVVLRIALLQCINSHQSILNKDKTLELPHVNLKTFSMDLNGDGRLEWLIGSEYQDYPLQNWLLIQKREDGLYHPLPAWGYALAGVSDYTTDIAVHDLTGDGYPELIKIQRYYLAGGIHGGLEVYTWKDGKLELYKSIELPGVPPPYGEGNRSEFAIDDFNGDGIAEIQVTRPRFKRFGCQWTQISMYYLDGRSPNLKVEGEEIPVTGECLIARALESNDPVEKIELYQKAMQKFDPKGSPADQLTWIKLQLVMAYTANLDDAQANSQLQELMNMEGEGKFLSFIKKNYLDANSPTPLVLCDALYSSIESLDMPQRLGSGIDIDLTHYAYPVDYAPIADLICPFPDVLAKRLEKIKIPVSHSPTDALIQQGYSLSWSRTLNWDEDLQMEWLGVLDFRQSMLVFMDGTENWNLSLKEIPFLDLSGPEVNIYDPGDGSGLRVLILSSGEGRFCDSPDTPKWLIEFDPQTMEYEDYYLCDSNGYSIRNADETQSTLKEFTKPYNFEQFDLPAWYYLPVQGEDEYERSTIVDLVHEMEKDIVGQANSRETTSRLSELIASLPKDDPAAQILLNHLYYLQGLNYELGGQKEQAVDAYLNLIKQSPESMWSEYARKRMQPVQP